jgi:DNA-binding NarL/FixJ family response regulator
VPRGWRDNALVTGTTPSGAVPATGAAGTGDDVGTSVPVTVVVVGDDAVHPGELPGVRLLARTGDPRRAPRLVGHARPQVVLVWLGRDRDVVLAAVTELVARVPEAPVLAVARAVEATEPAADVLAAVRAGAAGYVVTTGDLPALADALRRTAGGEAVFSPGLAEVVLEGRGCPTGAGGTRLTSREADVLRLVVDGLTARQIASRLVLSPRTVENHIQRVLRRLGVPNRAALVRYAIENGFA